MLLAALGTAGAMYMARPSTVAASYQADDVRNTLPKGQRSDTVNLQARNAVKMPSVQVRGGPIETANNSTGPYAPLPAAPAALDFRAELLAQRQVNLYEAYRSGAVGQSGQNMLHDKFTEVNRANRWNRVPRTHPGVTQGLNRIPRSDYHEEARSAGPRFLPAGHEWSRPSHVAAKHGLPNHPSPSVDPDRGTGPSSVAQSQAASVPVAPTARHGLPSPLTHTGPVVAPHSHGGGVKSSPRATCTACAS